MNQLDESPKTIPLFSIVIAAYNAWVPLDRCLRSLAQQAHGPGFEVIVVDDGSKEVIPESINLWRRHFPLRVIRQPPLGIAAARNRGLQASTGTVLLFVDSDCTLQRDCLSALGSAIADSPHLNCFQLHLVGERSGLVGRSEELRLAAVQDHWLQPNGCIRYLNTAGFAIRRARVDTEIGVFDTSVRRAEDTLLLADLIQGGELPLFVADAIIQHSIPLSLVACLLKDIRSAYLEGEAYDRIASKGVKIRVSHRARLSILWLTWKASGRNSIGKAGWLLFVARTLLQRTVSFSYPCLRACSQLTMSGRPS
jgi:glycosyltransferase involved in cell wall biosynthesis